MQIIELTISGEPIPKQSVRQGKDRYGNKVFYKDQKIIDRENDIKSQVLSKISSNHIIWREKPIKVNLTYVFEYPKTMPKKLIKAIENGETVYKTTKPDVGDNLNKLILDALEGLIYENDSEIVELTTSKVYGFNPRTEISLYFADCGKLLHFPTKKPKKM